VTSRGPQSPAPSASGPEASLHRFIAATEAGRFADALELLARRERERYTPKRFEADFHAEPQALERMARIKEAIRGPIQISGALARLPLDASHAVELVLEDGAWKVSALE
jgi:hypothetical protein